MYKVLFFDFGLSIYFFDCWVVLDLIYNCLVKIVNQFLFIYESSLEVVFVEILVCVKNRGLDYLFWVENIIWVVNLLMVVEGGDLVVVLWLFNVCKLFFYLIKNECFIIVQEL